MSVREWAEMFGLEPDPRVTSVAGFVMAQLGRVPRVGDSVTLGNMRVRVQQMDGRMVERVVVSVDERAGHSAERGDEEGASVSVHGGSGAGVSPPVEPPASTEDRA
jgi:Mg2+/Co2+ transporter CorC